MADETHFKAAKAIQDGMVLWCLWSTMQPFTKQGKEGFVVRTTADMRRMAHDLLRLADEIDAMSFWENEK